MLTTFLQLIGQLTHLPGYLKFKKALNNVEINQREKLTVYLGKASVNELGKKYGLSKNTSYEEFSKLVPIHNYQDLEDYILKQKQSPEENIIAPGCKRYEPTSGSTSARKWIPYTPELMSEFDAAASAWLFDMFKQNPKIINGKHYWSLSWIPTELREIMGTADDLEIFSAGKKFLMNQIMVAPSSISRLPDLKSSMMETMKYLVSTQNISLISVWSPTFLLELLTNISQHKAELCEMLPEKTTGKNILRNWDGEITTEFLKKLWPSLEIISAWDSSTSSIWASEIKKLFPHVTFQGKGLWATEGVVTTPFEGTYPLMITSHFYEFLDLDTGLIYPSWELKINQCVQPILTTGSGLLRIKLQDKLRVTGFLGKCPCLIFQGRIGGTDMVGEKLDIQFAQIILDKMNTLNLGVCTSLLAKTTNPHYVLLVQGDDENKTIIRNKIEELLKTSHHYSLARELGQLGHAECIIVKDSLNFFESSVRNKIRLVGGVKVEALAYWNNQE